jgi:hypothetical protein
MSKRITDRADLKSPTLWWRTAFFVLWLAGTAIIGMAHPQIVLVNTIILAVVWWTLMAGWPFDQIGALIAGLCAASVLGPGLLALAFHPVVASVNTLAVVATLVAFILVAVAIGFALGRWVGRSPKGL